MTDAPAPVDPVELAVAYIWRTVKSADERDAMEPVVAGLLALRQSATASGSRVAELESALRTLLPMVEEWHAEFPRDVGDKEPPAIEAARAILAKGETK